MTAPRIVRAEVLSHRLEVPLRSLERLPDEVGPLPLEVQTEKGDLLLKPAEGSSSLRFAVQGAIAVLVNVALVDDERGLFFQRVVGALMIRFRGDLHARLVWNLAEKNRDGSYVEVKVRAGVSSYPGFASARTEPPPLPTAAPTAEDEEVERLLARAKADWAKYQRLKSKA